jgi:hypothetical protein
LPTLTLVQKFPRMQKASFDVGAWPWCKKFITLQTIQPDVDSLLYCKLFTLMQAVYSGARCPSQQAAMPQISQ